MNKQGEPYIYRMLTETLLYQTITIGLLKTDTITISCTEHTDIHKRGVLERIVEPPL